MKNLIDIIIPFYEAHTTIDRCLGSVLMQKIKGYNIKVTLVDDCSKHGCVPIVDKWKEFLDIQQIRRDTNGGPGLARQTGLDATNGEFVIFMDADDTLIGSYAVQLLVNGVQDKDMCMGTFVEENPDGSMVPHAVNQIWMHGKIIRREAINRMKLKFNDTRQCEDMGWNSVFFHLTDKIVYVDKDVYLWQNTKNSLTREDAVAYKFGYGWRGMVENMAWACEELIKRNSENVREYCAVCLCGMHIRFCESLIYVPDDRSENLEKAKEFYRRAAEPIKDKLDYGYLCKVYKEVESQYNNSVVQAVSYGDFLKAIGYSFGG